jgi:hypothetical protein
VEVVEEDVELVVEEEVVVELVVVELVVVVVVEVVVVEVVDVVEEVVGPPQPTTRVS